MGTFIGVDLGWYGKPTGLASISLGPDGLSLRAVERLEDIDSVVGWIRSEASDAASVVGVDAPLVIRNQAGIRPAERDLNHDFRRFHAGCHPANLGRPFASHVLEFSRRLRGLGFRHGPDITAQDRGRFQIEVHPHAATVNLFTLGRIVKYKRGARQDRARELSRLRELMLTRLPTLDPPLRLSLPEIPEVGNLKPVEDKIDAVLCAYVAAHWWFWGKERNLVYGNRRSGYVVVPGQAASVVSTCQRDEKSP